MAEVSLRNVTKRFDTIEAVRGINLDIPDNELVVLVGPSGCGKSTTLRMIAGLEEVTSGDVLIGGEVVNDLPPKDRDIAMVFPELRALPAHDGLREHVVRVEAAQSGEGRDQKARGRGGAHPRHYRTFRAQAESALRRTAPARRHGARHRAQPESLFVRRTVVKSRRQAAGADADRNQARPPDGEDHDGLCHPRSGRGDDARRPRRGHEQRLDRADRQAAGALSSSENALCRGLHRLAGDEFHALPRGRERLRAARALIGHDQPAGAGSAR